MNLIISLSPKCKNIKDLLVSLNKSKKLGKTKITFAKDWVTALGYAAIDPGSCIMMSWDVVRSNFNHFYRELPKINRLLPYILIIDNNVIDGKVCSGTDQLLTIISRENFEANILEVISQISAYDIMVSNIPKEYKKYLKPTGFSSFIGNSSEMLSVYNQMIKVAPTDFTVFIKGNSGSGKELVARTIHELSPRKKERFQSLNCAAIPDNLLESELFGYEKGAFTDASQSKPGKFELADGGTIFLDEIGDMPLTIQSKLLRVLEEHTIERLGGVAEKEVDFRLLSATHQNLIDRIAQKTFREDLFHRLNVIPIQLPSLDQRKWDIPLLVLILLNRLVKKNNLRIKSISWDLIEKIYGLPLKGNVRELENILIRVIFHSSDMNLSQSDVIISDPVFNKEELGVPSVSLNEVVKPLWKLEKLAIEHALSKLNGNISKVASQLEISRSALYRKMKSYQISDTEEDNNA